MSPVDFSRHLSFTDFEKIASHRDKHDVNHFKFDEWTVLQDRYETSVLLPSIKGFFAELVQSGRMTKLAFNPASKLNMVTHWNAVCDPLTTPEQLDLSVTQLRHRINLFIFKYCVLDHVEIAQNADIYRLRYDALIARMNKGDLEYYELEGVEVCAETGLRVAFGLENWQLIPYGAKNNDYLRIDNIEPNYINEDDLNNASTKVVHRKLKAF